MPRSAAAEDRSSFHQVLSYAPNLVNPSRTTVTGRKAMYSAVNPTMPMTTNSENQSTGQYPREGQNRAHRRG